MQEPQASVSTIGMTTANLLEQPNADGTPCAINLSIDLEHENGDTRQVAIRVTADTFHHALSALGHWANEDLQPQLYYNLACHEGGVTPGEEGDIDELKTLLVQEHDQPKDFSMQMGTVGDDGESGIQITATACSIPDAAAAIQHAANPILINQYSVTLLASLEAKVDAETA